MVGCLPEETFSVNPRGMTRMPKASFCCISSRASVKFAVLSTTWLSEKLSRLSTNLRVLDVLSRSTTAIGRSPGSPSPIRVRRKTAKNIGTTIIPAK